MPVLESFRAASPGRQIILVVGAVALIGALLIAVYFLLLRTSYNVLFADLRTMDAATIVAELDKRKIPYRLEADGTTILVPSELVDSSRLSVMSEDLPLKGMVGFELFNKSDMGLTDFAQKINYQRALQGELARTIMTLDSVDTVRVHLALSEPTIFRDERSPPKASVTIVTRNGVRLADDAVRGIQRLVAAAVPDLETGNVVILDEHGSVMGGAFSSDSRPSPLAQEKHAIEEYYAAKIRQLLAKSYPHDAINVTVWAGFNAYSSQQQGSRLPAGTAYSSSDVETDAVPGNQIDTVLSGQAPERRDFRLRINLSSSAPLSEQAQSEIRVSISDEIGLAPWLDDTVMITTADGGWNSPEGVPSSVPGSAASTNRKSDVSASERGPFSIAMLWVLLVVLVVAGVAAIWRQRQTAPRKLSEHQRQELGKRLKRLLDQEDGHVFPPV